MLTLILLEWSGSAPFCTTAGVLLSPAVFFTSADCPSDFPIKQTTSKYGSGGEQPCLYDGGWKSYCCADPGKRLIDDSRFMLSSLSRSLIFPLQQTLGPTVTALGIKAQQTAGLDGLSRGLQVVCFTA